MKIAIKTMRDETKKMIHNSLLEEKGYEIAYIVEMNSSLWGETYEGIPIISPFDAINKYRAGGFSKIVLPGATIEWKLRTAYLDEVVKMGYKDEDILWGSVELYNGIDVEQSLIANSDFAYLDYVEFHTNDQCNLKCKNCNNFSNYVCEERVYNLDIFEKDFQQLKKLVDHILLIRLLGGEPLLNQDAYRYLQIVRSIYPYAEIHFVTNGILVKQMPQILIDTLKELDVIVEISAYPIMFDKLDDIVSFLKNNGIKNRIGWIGQSFLPPIIERYEYPLTTVDCKCIHIRDGKIARCPLIQYIGDYNKANGTDFDPNDGVIDIYEDGLIFKELHKRLCTPFELCNYCGFWRKDLEGEEWTNDKIN